MGKKHWGLAGCVVFILVGSGIMDLGKTHQNLGDAFLIMGIVGGIAYISREFATWMQGEDD